MKKQVKTAVIVLVTLLLIVTGTTVFAQGWGNPRGQEVTVEGTLRLSGGTIAIAGGDDATWFVPALFRYVGFIDGLKEGATVNIRGYTDGYDMLMPIAMTIDGKSYDLSFSADTRRGGYGWGGHRGGGYGGGPRGGWGHCW